MLILNASTAGCAHDSYATHECEPADMDDRSIGGNLSERKPARRVGFHPETTHDSNSCIDDSDIVWHDDLDATHDGECVCLLYTSDAADDTVPV